MSKKLICKVQLSDFIGISILFRGLMGHALVVWKRVLKKGTWHLVAWVKLYDPVMGLHTDSPFIVAQVLCYTLATELLKLDSGKFKLIANNGNL
jgi:hypothetical protein